MHHSSQNVNSTFQNICKQNQTPQDNVQRRFLLCENMLLIMNDVSNPNTFFYEESADKRSDKI